MSTLDISNVVTVTISSPSAGLAEYQINNLAILTKETPLVTLTNDYAVYTSALAVGTDWGTTSEAYLQASAIFSQTPNILSAGGKLIIATVGSSETLSDALTRTSGLVFYGGALVAGWSPLDAEYIAAATTAQSLKRLLFVSSSSTSSVTSGGLLLTIKAAAQDKARGLLYTMNGASGARLFAAAYAGRGLSTYFEGSATTQTMHMKTLSGIAPDTGISQTVLDQAVAAGADTYGQIETLGKVFCSGANGFFDDVFNLLWLYYSLQVAGFNAIATTSTKIPQTEQGVAVLRQAYLNVLQQAVNNGFVAPGVWNSADTFGDPASLRRNVEQQGYYIYSQPVNQQSQADRELRKAPLIQLAIKFAGAVHSSAVIVNFNA